MEKCERETAKWKCKLEHAKCETAKMWKCNEDVNVNMRNAKMQRNGNVNGKLQSGNVNVEM